MPISGGTLQHEDTGQQLYDLAAGDLNGDGRPEAVTADYGSRRFAVWPNTSGTFGAAVGFAVGNALEYVNYPSGVALADVDGDGKLDVLTTVSYSASAGLTVRRNTTPLPATALTSLTVADVTTTSAKVAATVSSADSDGTWKFGYGTSPAPSAFTTAQPLAAKSGSKAVDAVLTGLTPATTYHVRVLVTNAAGDAVGADVTFTTKAPAADQPGPTNGSDPGTGSGSPQPQPQDPAGPPAPQPTPPQPPASLSVTPVQLRFDQTRVIAATVAAFRALDVRRLLAGGTIAPRFVAREPGTLTIAGDAPGGASPRAARAAAKRKPVRLLAGRKAFKSAGAAKVPTRLTAKGRALLRKSKKLTVVLTTTWKSATGEVVVTTKRVTLKAKATRSKRG